MSNVLFSVKTGYIICVVKMLSQIMILHNRCCRPCTYDMIYDSLVNLQNELSVGGYS